MSHRNTFYCDQATNVTCVRDDDLGLTYHTYDLLNRTTSLKNPFGEVTYYEYLDCGQVSKRTLGNGCLTYYEYDVKGRVAKIDERESDMTQISELQYEYDKVGNPIKIEREDGSATYYEYDKTYQLTGETQVDDETQVEYDFAYEYDGAHNRTVKVAAGTPTYYTYNAANQMLTETTGAETTYYHYDGCGNTTAKQAPAGTTYYQYDTENLLTRIDFPDDTHSYYTYDADSKRVSQRTADGYSEFIYQGPDMLKLQVERDENGDTKVQYTMGNGLEAMRRDAGSGMSSGDSSFYHYNHLGTTVALTNAAASVSDTYRHDAWGVRLASTGSTVNPHTYVGRERYFRMPDAGFYHLGFRDYAQRVGRFRTVDPAGRLSPVAVRRVISLHYLPALRSPSHAILSGGAAKAPYVIGANRPVAMFDPTGLQPPPQWEAGVCEERWQRCISDQVNPLVDCIYPLLEDAVVPLPSDWEVFALCAIGCVPIGVGTGPIGYAECLALCLGIGDIISDLISIAPVWYYCNRELREGRESCLFSYAHCCYMSVKHCGEACSPPSGGWDGLSPGNPGWWERRR